MCSPKAQLPDLIVRKQHTDPRRRVYKNSWLAFPKASWKQRRTSELSQREGDWGHQTTQGTWNSGWGPGKKPKQQHLVKKKKKKKMKLEGSLSFRALDQDYLLSSMTLGKLVKGCESSLTSGNFSVSLKLSQKKKRRSKGSLGANVAIFFSLNSRFQGRRKGK